MGSLRFLLACLVLLSHLGISIVGLNPGVIAVVIFYVLAGHVVAGLWTKWQYQPNPLICFYHDRSWRILPQYGVAVLFATLLWLNGAQSPFLTKPPALVDWLSNLAIIPLNYFMYTGQDRFTLIPPAWSLATEIQFYLLAPLLLSQKLSRLIICLVLSLIIFVLAQYQWLDTDYYGYRLLPGILFIFIIGALQELRHRHKALTKSLVALGLLNALYLLWLWIWGTHRPYNSEVSLGLLIAMPLLAALSKKKLPQQSTNIGSRLNKALGALSYGVFLYHFPVIWLLKLSPPVTAPKDIIIVIALTISCAAIGHWAIERPLWRRFR